MTESIKWSGLPQLAVDPEVKVAFLKDYIGYQRRPHGWRTPDWKLKTGRHIVYYVQDGRIRLPDQGLTAEPGAALWVAPGQHGRVSFDPGVCFYEVWFTLKSRGEWITAYPHTRLVPMAQEVQLVLENLTSELQQRNPDMNISRHWLALLLALAARKKMAKEGMRLLNRWQQDQVVRWMHDHMGERVSIADLAKAAGLSADYFSRLFKETFGVSPRIWMKQERLRFASRLLTETTAPVYAIASDLGYKDPVLFQRQFKSAFGCTPGTYRRSR